MLGMLHQEPIIREDILSAIMYYIQYCIYHWNIRSKDVALADVCQVGCATIINI